MYKSNTAVYFYDYLMISAIVSKATVFIIFNHVCNKKKIRENFSEGKEVCLNFGRENSRKGKKND